MKKALVLGYGRSGKAAEAVLKAQGYEVAVADGYDLVVASPGLRVESELQLFGSGTYTFVALNPCFDAFHFAHLHFSSFGIFPESRVLCAELFFFELHTFFINREVLFEFLRALLNLF